MTSPVLTICKPLIPQPCEVCSNYNPQEMCYRRGLERAVSILCPKCELLTAHPGDPTEWTEPAADGKKRLYDYQVANVVAARHRQVFILGDEMGLGKTAQALRSVPKGYGVLLACKRGVDGNWQDEIAEWRPDLRFMHDNTLIRRGQPPQPGHFHAVTYEGLRDGKLIKGGPYVLILDEAHKYRNDSGLKRRLRKQVKQARLDGNRILALTATLILDRPSNLQHMLEGLGIFKALFGGHQVLSARQHFNSLFRWYPGRFPTDDERQAIYDHMAPVMARRLVRVRRPLRAIKKVNVKATIDDQTAEEINRALRAMIALVRATHEARAAGNDPRQKGIPKETRAFRFAAIKNRAKEIERTARDPKPEEMQEIVDLLRSKDGGILFHEISLVKAAMAKAKIGKALELVERHERAKEPTLVFCDNVAPLDAIGKREGWGVIHGKVVGGRRKALVDAFMDGTLEHGLALSIDVGSEGLNLTRAAHVILIGLTWTPAKIAQAIARANRNGQTRQVTVTEVFADHQIEEMIARVIEKKRAVAELFNWREVEPQDVTGYPIKLKHPELHALPTAEEIAMQEEEELEAAMRGRPTVLTLKKIKCPSCSKKEPMEVHYKQRDFKHYYVKLCRWCRRQSGQPFSTRKLEKHVSPQDAKLLKDLEPHVQHYAMFPEAQTSDHTSEIA